MTRRASYTLLVGLIVTSNLVAIASSANVLFLMPLATKSETHLLNSMAKGMLNRGHSVTLVTPASASIDHPNFKEIIPTKPLDLSDFDPNHHPSVVDMRRGKDDLLALLSFDLSFLTDRCHQTYKHKDFAEILRTGEGTYDLVLTGAGLNECFYGAIHKLKAPFVQISSMPILMELLEATGLRTPLSFVPNPFLGFSDKMSLSDRLVNTVTSWIYKFIYLSVFNLGEKAYKEHLGDNVPSVDEIRKNVSLIFTNTHFSVNHLRPLMQDVVEIGGVHIQTAKPLPEDLEEFCSGGDDGFILFSLGTVFREESMPENLMKVFINVFSRLKIRVLWKWQSEVKGLPDNVKTSKWLPQQDILAHPNIKLFISHGGLLSTQEATYYGVPIVGIPIFADQDVNMIQTESRGYGIKLELLNMTEEYLEGAIHAMLTNVSYAENAKQASAIFRDQPQTPLERAVYWMEYVIKFKGAPQLRSSARDLSYFEYYSYDVEIILLSILGVIIYINYKIISFCLACMGCRKSKKKVEAKSVKKDQ